MGSAPACDGEFMCAKFDGTSGKYLKEASVSRYPVKILWRMVYYVGNSINDGVNGVLLSGNSLSVPPETSN